MKTLFCVGPDGHEFPVKFVDFDGDSVLVEIGGSVLSVSRSEVFLG